MKLTKYERETIVCYNEEEATASVFTHNNQLIKKLKRLAEKYPDKVKPERPEHCEADSLRAKTAKIRPPDRSIRSENE